MAVADRTLQILPGGQGAAPFSYVLPASTSFTLLAVRAVFDGSASASAWLPCVQIVSDAGVVMAQTVGSSVAAGASADVTFAPFLEAATAGAASSGIQFDVDPQPGNFFEMETVGPSFLGLTISDKGPGGLYLTSEGGGFLNIHAVAQLLVQASRFTLNAVNNVELNGSAVFVQGNSVRTDTFTFADTYLDAAGGMVRVLDHFGNPIFEVWEDGSIHGRAAVGAITWDL